MLFKHGREVVGIREHQHLGYFKEIVLCFPDKLFCSVDFAFVIIFHNAATDFVFEYLFKM